MKFTAVLSTIIFSSIIVSFSSNAAEEHLAKSKISSVTVFSDRAQVTRICTMKLGAGENTLIFDNLPSDVDQRSLTVNGSGNGTLIDTKFRNKPFAGATDSMAASLSTLKRIYEDSLTQAQDLEKRCLSEKQFVENIAAKITDRTPSQQSSQPELDNAKWEKMIGFYSGNLESLDNRIRITENLKRVLNDSLIVINERISNLGREEGSELNQAAVKVMMNEAGTITLELSYIVYGPSWTPAYELRLLSDKKLLRMTYKGVLRQNTGEDWENSQIKLSTAQPCIGGDQPELSPWYVNILQKNNADYGYAKKAIADVSMSNQMMSGAGGIAKTEAAAAPAPKLMMRDAAVETGATSVLFAIPAATTVTSDNEEHTVTIMTKEFPAQLRYSTVPKRSPYAYLKAKVKNETDYPLLSGTTSIFLDNAFVANSNLNLVSPKEEFWTFLGVDQAVKVEYKLINRFERNDGLIAKKNKVVFEYLTTVTNNRKSSEEVVVWDQLPISGNENVKVEMIEPKIKENTQSLKKNENDYLEWYYKLNAGESVKVPFKFSVEYPQGKTIEGL